MEDYKIVKVKKGDALNKIIKKQYNNSVIPIVLGKINNKIYELTSLAEEDGDFKPIDITAKIGNRTYARTLQFVLIRAVRELFPDAQITIEHSLSKGIFGEIHKSSPLNEGEVLDIKNKMQKLIDKDINIKKSSFSKEEAIKIFSEYKMEDKVKLLKYVINDRVKLYEMDGIYDYFYGTMAYSTGILKIFDIVFYEPGFILRFPTEENPIHLPPFIEYKKLSKIFYETEVWDKILGVAEVGSLNEKVENGDIIDIIRVAEAFHEKKIAYIADMISERKDTKLILIAGPTSSGKTTFAKRLSIQLRVNGYMPYPISLDDYFLERAYTPRDENGDYDFESIYALDLEFFNKSLQKLLRNEEVEIPSFNFKTGKREWRGNPVKLPQNGIMLVEGIHSLNEMLTNYIPKENKFKVYISALTQLNLDSHNRIATTDVRILRRIVRDYLSRGYGGEETLRMWPSIKTGEEKNIFVFQEEADVMFNSTLIYELCILKKYALAELSKIKKDSVIYYEALRLISFLNFFKAVENKYVPENSILREFIGGSCFYEY